MPFGGTCFGPGDLDFMARILMETLPPSATDMDKQLQTASLLCLYGSGVTDTDQLIHILKEGSHSRARQDWRRMPGRSPSLSGTPSGR
ncbi:hypothetical protein EDC40_11744 [Aminobacter aminovorans]|uniref:Uncharacterized protein n=1 Tax=Aminobacter aminovorans TaxID=83263 RepID=A0A381ILD7_AMIAI|nr:hypothetical protein EDC40_11744 [Aminobacter aminovorans]SUY28299.1 Uncharacterised protein [Aminobacter aminovorans]